MLVYLQEDNKGTISASKDQFSRKDWGKFKVSLNFYGQKLSLPDQNPFGLQKRPSRLSLGGK